MQYQTQFGSLDKFQKGTIELINDKAKHYVFSNIFDVASRSKPYEKVVVGKNLQYVIEALRAEGDSAWFAASHDEFAVAMEGEIEVHYIKLDDARTIVPASKEGSVRIQGTPSGKKMGVIKLKRGHQALLPAGAAYQFRAKKRGVLMLQTILGENSVEKWAEICHQ
ncbi:MAG: hydroxyquinol 1,2-dioxygenase [Burkholderiales bacterium]